jgi:hypothetical protein
LGPERGVSRVDRPYTLRGRRYVLAIVYPTDASFEGDVARLPFSRASAAVPAACGASDGGALVFEETYVVGALERDAARSSGDDEIPEATDKALTSCAGESGATWEAACAGYEPPEDDPILYADPCDWYYRAPPPNVVAPGRYDRAALAEARQLVRARGDIHDRLALLAGLSELCERRCSRAARAEIWELRGSVAREMGWPDGVQRALAEAATLREGPASGDAP